MDTIRYRMYSYSTAVSVRYFHEVEEVTRNRYLQACTDAYLPAGRAARRKVTRSLHDVPPSLLACPGCFPKGDPRTAK